MGRRTATPLFLTLLLATLLFGCGGPKAEPAWTAAVTVSGDRATLTVDVPGKELGKEYHPHISLDGGPVVMMFDPAYTFRNLKPGHHSVQVEIADPAHNLIRGMSKRLEFDIP